MPGAQILGEPVTYAPLPRRWQPSDHEHRSPRQCDSVVRATQYQPHLCARQVIDSLRRRSAGRSPGVDLALHERCAGIHWCGQCRPRRRRDQIQRMMSNARRESSNQALRPSAPHRSTKAVRAAEPAPAPRGARAMQRVLTWRFPCCSSHTSAAGYCGAGGSLHGWAVQRIDHHFHSHWQTAPRFTLCAGGTNIELTLRNQ